MVAIGEHGVRTIPDWACSEVWKQSPASEKYEIEHWCQSQVLLKVKVSHISPCNATLGIIHLEELVSAKEATEAHVGLHDDGAADHNCEHKLLEKTLHHPGVLLLCIHHKLRSDAKLPQHETEKFNAFKAVKLPIVPKFASGLKKRIPRTGKRERQHPGRQRIRTIFFGKLFEDFRLFSWSGAVSLEDSIHVEGFIFFLNDSLCE